VLARGVTGLVHGQATVRGAESISAALFGGDVGALTEARLRNAAQAMPLTEVAANEAESLPWPDLLVRVGLADSKRAARELISSGGVQINGSRLEPAAAPAPSAAAMFGKYLILRKGKKTYHAVRLT